MYDAVPTKRLVIVQLTMLAGMEAAMASWEYQVRNIRSMKCWIVQEPVLRISGKAICSTSR